MRLVGLRVHFSILGVFLAKGEPQEGMVLGSRNICSRTMLDLSSLYLAFLSSLVTA